MADKKSQGAASAPVWGIFLLSLGIIFLLQTLDILPWGLWGTLWRFWPVLIIIIGLGILFRRYNVWLTSLLILAILGTSLGIAIWQYRTSSPADMFTESYSEPLGGMERAQIEIDFTAGSITIGSLPPGSPNLVEADSEVMAVDFYRQDGEGVLYLSTKPVNRQFWGEDRINWQVNLTRSIPLTINIKSAASNMELNLSDLIVTELQLDIDAANCKLTLPSSASTTYIYIEVDAANLEIIIPAEVAAKIEADVDLAVLDIDKNRFPESGKYYMSRDFDSAENRVELEIDCAVGRVEVR